MSPPSTAAVAPGSKALDSAGYPCDLPRPMSLGNAARCGPLPVPPAPPPAAAMVSSLAPGKHRISAGDSTRFLAGAKLDETEIAWSRIPLCVDPLEGVVCDECTDSVSSRSSLRQRRCFRTIGKLATPGPSRKSVTCCPTNPIPHLRAGAVFSSSCDGASWDARAQKQAEKFSMQPPLLRRHGAFVQTGMHLVDHRLHLVDPPLKERVLHVHRMQETQWHCQAAL